MGGRPPDNLAEQLAADTFTLTTHELAGKYDIAESTVRDWRLYCKRKLKLAVGYGTGRSTVEEASPSRPSSHDSAGACAYCAAAELPAKETGESR